MSSALGKLTGQLAEPIESIPVELLDLLNENIKPPQKLNADEVFIRAMYLVSDEVNSYGGRFPAEEHERLAGLLIDSPVLVGHRQDKLPVGRNFHARLVEREEKNWIKSYFYWLKSAEGAQNLLKNIDGGVYKECSIGFTFRLPECSICGKDIRLCEHEPFEKYAMPGGEVTCHFLYRQIEKVLETSLVYRGAIPDTSISRKLSAQTTESGDFSSNSLTRLHDLSQLDDGQYLIIPAYQSLSVNAKPDGDHWQLTDNNGNEINFKPACHLPGSASKSTDSFRARVVGFRGKQRCSTIQIRDFLAGQSSIVSRVQLMLLPDEQLAVLKPEQIRKSPEVRVIPYRQSSLDSIDESIRQVMTREGVEIWPVNGFQLGESGYRFRFDRPSNADAGSYNLTSPGSRRSKTLALNHPQLDGRVQVHDYQIGLARLGRSFVADIVEDDHYQCNQLSKSSPNDLVQLIKRENDGYRIVLSGVLAGQYLLRPIRIGERARYLFTRTRASKSHEE